MCSPRNDKFNPSYSKFELAIKSLLRTWFLWFNWFSFFAFWVAEKHVFHIDPFRPTRYVLKGFRWMEVCNRVRKWNNVKKHIYVRSKLESCQLEIRIFIYKLMCQMLLVNSVSLVFCEFDGVRSWNEGKTIILVRSSIQIPRKNTVFKFKVNVCQSKHAFP